MSVAGSTPQNSQDHVARSARRASIDTVEYREIVAKLRDAVKRDAPTDEVALIESDLIRHIDAHLTTQIVGVPVGTVDYLPGTTGFTAGVFKAEDVPPGTQVYTGSANVAEIAETHLILSELCSNFDPKVKIDELARMVREVFSMKNISVDKALAGDPFKSEEVRVLADDLFGTILWLYRRLPMTYGRQGFVDAAIEKLAAILKVDAAEHIAERDSNPTLWNRGALPKKINDLLLHIQNVLDKDNWRKIEEKWMDAAETYIYLGEITSAAGDKPDAGGQ
jgi:hypothetical protein